jgi:hypothetical protein
LSYRAVQEGRLDDARALQAQSLRIDLELGNIPFVSVDLVRFALIFARAGEPLVGAQLLSHATVLRHEIGMTLESWMEDDTNEALAAVRVQDEEAFMDAWEAGERMSLDEAVALVLEQLSGGFE